MKKIFKPIQLEIYFFEGSDVFMEKSFELSDSEMPPVGIFGETNFG